MSTSKRITRLAVATALGVVLAGTVAAPAFAEDVIGVSLSGVPSSFTAGARPDSFTVSLRNNSNATVAAVTVRFTVSLNGLTASQLRIRVGGADLPVQDAGPGQVVANDPRSHDFFPRIGRTEIGYTIEFLTGTPSGRANFTASAMKQTSVLGTASDSISIKGGAVAASATPTPNPTDSATPDGGVVASPSALANGPLADNSTHIADDGSGGIPIGLYIMGAILVGVGGVILWLLFKQRPQALPAGDLPTGEYDQAPLTLGYPSARATATPPGPSSLAPTAQLPALRSSTHLGPPTAGPGMGQPPLPPPPVDPWDSQAGGRPPRHSAE
jgi:hypothetical protein